MDRRERRQLRDAVRDVAAWVEDARTARGWREATEAEAQRQLALLRERMTTLDRRGVPAWRVVPVTRAEADVHLQALAARANLPEINETHAGLLRRLTERAAPALPGAARLATWRRFVTSRAARRKVEPGARYLRELHAWGVHHDLAATLTRLRQPTGWIDPAALTVGDLLDPRLGLLPALVHLGTPSLVDAGVLGELPRALADLDAVVATGAPLRRAVQDAAGDLRRPHVEERLQEMRLDELRQVTTERLRLDLLAAAGFATVHDVLAGRRADLTRITGIGPKSTDVLVSAAEELREIARDETPVRLDPEQRTTEAARLVTALCAWDARRRTAGAGDDLARAEELRPLGAVLHDDVTHLLVLPLRPWRTVDLIEAVTAVVRRAELVAVAPARSRAPDSDPWSDFVRRPADYYAMLADVGVLTGEHARNHGDLPVGLVDTVAAQDLRTDHLVVTLRGYQAFAARFALVQKRVVIGDEMGLGKTIEALAVLAHLWAAGGQRFPVICPAAVVTNWMREIEAKSSVPAHRLHGPDFEAAFGAWQRDGGVGVITFQTLGWRDHLFEREVDRLDCVVVDEAHYVKNPDTWRAQATRAQLAKSDRALLLTGTPMENHVDEFRTLIGYLRPDLARDSEQLAPRAFRLRVAPAYLRRNVEDVLTELPELVETEEWLEMSDADLTAYRAAVAEGSFAAMRRAALLQGLRSAKVERLIELVEEAEDNGRRVVVFSYFRDVLASLAGLLPGPVFGPLTGEVAADARQRLIDDFSAAEDGAVLLAQITTGGVGINIQAASVVVICEPQLKPTTEAQAIARAHRMGQLRSVQVHRLLSEDSVDERVTEILAVKRRLFDDFVRVSETADAAPEATDHSDAEIARQVVAAERERLLYAPPTVVTPDD